MNVFIAHGGWDTVIIVSFVWLVIIVSSCIAAFYFMRRICGMLGLVKPTKSSKKLENSNDQKTE